MNETWIGVVGWESAYEVSDCGRVKTLKRFVTKRNGVIMTIPERIRKTPKDKKGYPNIRLIRDNVAVSYKVSRLVAIAFIANPDNLPEVNHIDGVKTNNRVTNLEWVTSSQNAQHAWDTGLKSGIMCASNPFFKGAIKAYNSSGKVVAHMEGRAEINLNGFNDSHVYACLNGKLKRHKGCTFKRQEAA